jgi:hypothetical protein
MKVPWNNQLTSRSPSISGSPWVRCEPALFDELRHDLATLGLGYVVKAHAGSELLPAVEAVLQGRQFFSSGLSSRHRSDATGTQAPHFS